MKPTIKLLPRRAAWKALAELRYFPVRKPLAKEKYGITPK